ncbi:MAG TPA: hypothetical protein VN408_18530 [Actinoplanes sp.]|nr:hypothetical protein [Actinoplanes sp.]
MASAMLSAAFNLGIAGGAALGGALLPYGGIRGDHLAGGLLVAVAFTVLAVFSRPVRGTALVARPAVEKDVPGESRRPRP